MQRMNYEDVYRRGILPISESEQYPESQAAQRPLLKETVELYEVSQRNNITETLLTHRTSSNEEMSPAAYGHLQLYVPGQGERQ